MALSAFWEIENGNSKDTQSVNRVAQSATNESLEELIRLHSQSLQKPQLQSNQVPTGSNRNKDKNLKRSRSLSNDSRSGTRAVRGQYPQVQGRTHFLSSDNDNRDNGSSSQRKNKQTKTTVTKARVSIAK